MVSDGLEVVLALLGSVAQPAVGSFPSREHMGVALSRLGITEDDLSRPFFRRTRRNLVSELFGSGDPDLDGSSGVCDDIVRFHDTRVLSGELISRTKVFQPQLYMVIAYFP